MHESYAPTNGNVGMPQSPSKYVIIDLIGTLTRKDKDESIYKSI